MCEPGHPAAAASEIPPRAGGRPSDGRCVWTCSSTRLRAGARRAVVDSLRVYFDFRSGKTMPVQDLQRCGTLEDCYSSVAPGMPDKWRDLAEQDIPSCRLGRLVFASHFFA